MAARDNGKGIIGVAPRASIVGYNILERPFSTFTLTLLDAVDAFTRNMEDIAVSNNSWGIPYLSYDFAPQLWTEALRREQPEDWMARAFSTFSPPATGTNRAAP